MQRALPLLIVLAGLWVPTVAPAGPRPSAPAPDRGDVVDQPSLQASSGPVGATLRVGTEKGGGGGRSGEGPVIRREHELDLVRRVVPSARLVRAADLRFLAFGADDALARAGLLSHGTTAPPPFQSD